MAFTTNSKNKNDNFEKAPAFLNVKLVNSKGKSFVLKCVIPLYEDNGLHAAIMEKAKADPDAVFQLTGLVHFVTEDPSEFDL